MSNSWDEVANVEREGRHELVLSGDIIAKKYMESGLDENIFNLTAINFLEISKAGLTSFPITVEKLHNLLNLVLHSNSLLSVPSEIGKLIKLKFLDLSKNKLKTLPEALGELKDLQSFNASCNELNSCFDVSGLISLHVLDISHNNLECLPTGIDSPQLTLLQSIIANDNKLNDLPTDLNNLSALKTFDISNNSLSRLPTNLSICPKLKEFKYSGNKLIDKRLAKMAEQCSTKAILDYLFNQMEKEAKGKSGKESGTKGAKSTKKTAKKIANNQAVEDDVEDKNTIEIQHLDAEPGSIIVTSTASVESVRPYIVCCIIRNVNLKKSNNMYKRFINLQNKMHDEACSKRVIATIATHDLEKIKPHLTYDAQEPDLIQIQPLMKLKTITASVLMARLRHEAEELRKEKKRNTISGIHKYLELLQGESLYPCLIDSSNVVISFPPITNSNITRISQSTQHILIEITSSQSREVCKKIMDQFIYNILEMNLGETQVEAETRREAEVKNKLTEDELKHITEQMSLNENKDADDEAEDKNEEMIDMNRKKYLLVQQVKIVDHLGSLKIVYPSKIDLKSEKYNVVRDFLS